MGYARTRFRALGDDVATPPDITAYTKIGIPADDALAYASYHISPLVAFAAIRVSAGLGVPLAPDDVNAVLTDPQYGIAGDAYQQAHWGEVTERIETALESYVRPLATTASIQSAYVANQTANGAAVDPAMLDAIQQNAYNPGTGQPLQPGDVDASTGYVVPPEGLAPTRQPIAPPASAADIDSAVSSSVPDVMLIPTSSSPSSEHELHVSPWVTGGLAIAVLWMMNGHMRKS